MGTESMFQFVSSGMFDIPGRGTVYTVSNPGECSNFTHLIGQEVKIDGTLHKIIGVERNAHSPPWRMGEAIGLFVESVKEET